MTHARRSSGESRPPLWRRLRDWLHGNEDRPILSGPATIQVWDTDRNAYRDVSLDDRYDPLWPAACELADLRREIRHAA